MNKRFADALEKQSGGRPETNLTYGRGGLAELDGDLAARPRAELAETPPTFRVP